MTTPNRSAFESAALETLGLGFLVDLFEEELRLEPDRLDLLASLGELYTRVGRLADGLRIDRRLTELLPTDPIAHYNLACSLSLIGRVDLAFAALREAVALGYQDFEFLEKDGDLRHLRADPKFQAWFRRFRRGRPKAAN